MTPFVTWSQRGATRAKQAGLVVALVSAAIWVALAPLELTMGTAIRVVYLHVAATLAGLACLYTVGVLAVMTAFRSVPALEVRLRPLWIAGLTAFLLGFILSLLSATISWGGILWAEPRLRASVAVVIVGLVSLWVAAGIPAGVMRRLTWTIAAALSYGLVKSAPLYIHPVHPFQDSTSVGIRAAFLGISSLFLIATLFFAALLPKERE